MSFPSDRLASKFSRGFFPNPGGRGRLAPSPTGAQHLGNARTFLIAWLAAKLSDSTLILRIEDLDSPRVKPWATQQAIEDLHWLGLDADITPDSDSDIPSRIQSERIDRYREVLLQLAQKEDIYPCTCSRSEIAAATSAPHEQTLDAPVYPGTCRFRTARDAEALRKRGIPFAWRFRMPNQPMSIDDKCMGIVHVPSLAVAPGDFVVGRADGTPAYQLAVVVDDHDMQIDQVVRGDDLMLSTFRQRALARALDWTSPATAHLPLVIGPDGKRLAKRHGDTRLSHFREIGIRPEQLIGFLAWKSGLLPDAHSCMPKELVQNADLHRIPRTPLIIDSQELFQEWKLGRSLPEN